MKSVNIAIIGTNFISDSFCEALLDVKGVRAAAVLSRRPETGKAFADKHNIEKVYTELAAMLADPQIDAVYVASPTFMHKEQSIAAMRAGKHVLCEKMIAVTESDFLEMLSVSERTGTVLLEAMRPDFDGAHELVRSQLHKIGRIRRAAFNYCQYSSRYDKFKAGVVLNAFNPELKNSALADIGIYPLHTCISYFGKPKDVYSASVFLDNGFEGAGEVLLTYSGMTATVSYSKIADNVTPSVIEGELGSVTISGMNAPRELMLYIKGNAPERIPFTPKENNMSYEIEAFLDMINGKTSPKPYLKLTADTMNTVEKIYKSSKIF